MLTWRTSARYWIGNSSVRDIYFEVTWGQTTGWANFLDDYYA